MACVAARVEWPSRGATGERSDGGGQDASGRSYYFGIYRSADLATWEQIPGGALPVDDRKNCGHSFTSTPEIGTATGIAFLPDGTVQAAAEPTHRGGGSALVEDPVP